MMELLMGNSSDVRSSTSPYLTSGEILTSLPITVRQCESEWSEYNNHCYKLMQGEASWFEAEERCKLHGASLTSILNVSETNFIKSLIAYPTRVWIGLRKVGRWQWSDGSRVIYRNWNPGEPSSSILPKKGSGKCATLYMKDARKPRIAIGPRNKKGKWNNFVCNMNYPFLCKVPN
ncbi:snaclec 5-like [Branchiostoma floridae x Branchiostoma belcheri]